MRGRGRSDDGTPEPPNTSIHIHIYTKYQTKKTAHLARAQQPVVVQRRQGRLHVRHPVCVRVRGCVDFGGGGLR